MKKVKLYILVLIGIMLMVSPFVSGCSKNAEVKAPTEVKAPATGPINGGVLRVMTLRTPAAPIGTPSRMVGITTLLSVPALETLWRLDANGEIIPVLATDWVINPQGLSITWNLRKGVKFHDGSPWNADAAKNTFDTYIKTGVSGVKPFKSVDIINEYAIRLNLSEYTTNIAYTIADIWFISPTAVTTNGKEWADWHPVGTGPFKFKNYKADVSLEYDRFEGYWGDKSHLDGIKFIFVSDLTTQSFAMQAGDAQVLISEDPKQVHDLGAVGFETVSKSVGFIALDPDSNNPGSIFDNRNVRMALDYAIDREQLCKVLGYGLLTPNYQIATNGAQGYLPDLELHTYNPEKAKQLMAVAGYPKERLKTQIIGSPAVNQNMLLVFQNALKSIDIDAELTIVTNEKWINMRSITGWTGLIYSTVGLWGGECVSNWNRQFGTKGAILNPSVKRPEGWGALLDKAMAETDLKAQRKLAQQLSKMAYDDAMVISVASTNLMTVSKKGVHDMNIFLPGFSPFWWNAGSVWLEKDLQ